MKKQYLRLVRRAFRTLRHPHLRHRGWWRRFSRPLFHRSLWHPCRDTVASGLAVGMFFSMMPMPMQSLAAAVVAMALRGNVPLAIAACWISNPLTQLPVWLFQCRLGEWFRTAVAFPLPQALVDMVITLPGAGALNAAGFLLGCALTGVVFGGLGFLLTHLFATVLPHHLPVRRRSRPILPPSGVRSVPPAED